jgi:uncharacterized protein YdaU (DUF1376 family)
MGAIPYFPIFASDLLMDDELFKLEPKAEGLLLRMWCLCWVDGYAPKDADSLSLKVRRPVSYVRKYLPNVLPFFKVDTDGNLYSKRIEAEREKAAGKSEKCRDAVNARWNKRKGINTDEHTDVSSNESTEPIPSLSLSLSTTTPPTPKGASSRRRKGNTLDAFSPEASRIVGELRPLWRKEDPDGRPIRVDLSLWGQRLDEILKGHPEVTPDLLIEAGKAYSQADRFRYQAPQFFFGVGREGTEAAWVGYVRLLITKRSQEVALAS